jgi:hypothetical protein
LPVYHPEPTENRLFKRETPKTVKKRHLPPPANPVMADSGGGKAKAKTTPPSQPT